jgi:hypothetical protein
MVADQVAVSGQPSRFLLTRTTASVEIKKYNFLARLVVQLLWLGVVPNPVIALYT